MRKKWLVIGLSLLMALLVTGNTFAAGKQEAAKAGQPAIKLVWWSMWNETEPQAKVYKEAVNDYMSQHPKVQVSIQWNGREIRKTLPPALDANTQMNMQPRHGRIMHSNSIPTTRKPILQQIAGLTENQ